MNIFFKSVILVTIGLSAIISVPVTALADATFQSVNVHVFDTDIAVGGAATLIRDEDSVEARLTMSGLDTGASYSVWFVVFNFPAACNMGAGPPCGLDDLADPDVGLAVANAGGFVTGADGTGYMAGELEEGALPKGLPGFGTFDEPFTSDIHLIIQSHGDIVPGMVAQQISLPNGEDQFAAVFLGEDAPPEPIINTGKRP
jgi:hypothetical protein